MRMPKDFDLDEEDPSLAAESTAPKVDLYAVLGLPKDVSTDDLKRTYRKLALKLHPDKNPGNQEAMEKFQEVGKAYAVLSDPAKRKYYDETGDTEELDVAPEEFIGMFQEMMRVRFTVSNIQGTFREHSGNNQGTFREHSGNIRGIVGE
jgi:DnaJ family protein C protein 9